MPRSGSLAPRGNGAELAARAEVKSGKLDELAKSVTGSGLAKGPFDLAFNVQGEGLSPPGVVAGLSGEGTLSLGAGALQSLSSAPLRGVAATAAKKTIKADKEEIEAETQSVREKITKGIYKYAPAKLAFEIKNGTLRLAPATLVSPGAETKVNGYVELASLKLDSEWAVSLAGGGNKDVPPVTLVFTGALNKAGEISPADRYCGHRGLSHHAAHAGGRRAAGDARRERQDAAACRSGARGDNLLRA